MIRVGLLHVPEVDARASEEVRTLLRPLGAIMLQEEGRVANRNWIADTLRRWSDEEELDLILTIGGTLPAPGPSAAECVPEATLDVLDRLAPGLSEAMRAEVGIDYPLALLDRGGAGIRSRTLILNLPEGGAAGLFLAAVVDVLPSFIAHLQGDAHAPRLADIGVADADPESMETPAEPSSQRTLDADEFAAFLRRSK